MRRTSLEDPRYTQRRLMVEWERHIGRARKSDFHVGEAFYWDYNNSLQALQRFSSSNRDGEFEGCPPNLAFKNCRVIMNPNLDPYEVVVKRA